MHVIKQKMSAVHLSLASLGVTVELPGRKTGLLSIPETNIFDLLWWREGRSIQLKLCFVILAGFGLEECVKLARRGTNLLVSCYIYMKKVGHHIICPI